MRRPVAALNWENKKMNTFLDYAGSRREAFQERFILPHFKAKNLMSQEEWDAMYASIEKERKLKANSPNFVGGFFKERKEQCYENHHFDLTISLLPLRIP